LHARDRNPVTARQSSRRGEPETSRQIFPDLLEIEGVVAVPDDRVGIALGEPHGDAERVASQGSLFGDAHGSGTTDSRTAARKFPPAPKELTSARCGGVREANGPEGSASARAAATSCPPPAAAISPIASLTAIARGTSGKSELMTLA